MTTALKQPWHKLQVQTQLSPSVVLVPDHVLETWMMSSTAHLKVIQAQPAISAAHQQISGSSELHMGDLLSGWRSRCRCSGCGSTALRQAALAGVCAPQAEAAPLASHSKYHMVLAQWRREGSEAWE